MSELWEQSQILSFLPAHSESRVCTNSFHPLRPDPLLPVKNVSPLQATLNPLLPACSQRNQIHSFLPAHSKSRVSATSETMLTREDNGEDDEMCIEPKRRKTMDLYMKEREGKPNADCQCRSPMPSTSAEPSSSRWGQGRPMGAGEANGGSIGQWGQARLGGGRRSQSGLPATGHMPEPASTKH